MVRKTRGFTVLQYAVLMWAVAAAAVMMYILIKKAAQERYRQNMEGFSGGKLYKD